MALVRQLVPIAFGQGIDTKTDPKQQVLGTLRQARNIVFESINQFKKRNGYDEIVLKDTTGTRIEGAANLTRFKNELGIFADNQFYSFSPSLERVLNKGYTYTARPTSVPVLNNSYNHEAVDSIALEKINVYFYRNSSLGSVHYSVQDSESKSILVSDAVVATGASFCRVSHINNTVYLIYSVGTNLKYRSFNIFDPTTLGAEQSLANDLDSGAPIFDATSTSVKVLVGYHSTNVSGHVRIASIASDGSVGTGFGISGSPIIQALDLFTDSLERVVVAYASSTAVVYAILNFQLTGLLLSPTTVETVSNVANITGFEVSQGSYKYYYEISAASSVNHFVRRNTALLNGTVGTAELFVRSLGLATKVFEQNDIAYVTCAFDSELQSTYFVLDEQATVVCKISPELGGGHIEQGVLARVATPTTTTRAIPSLVKGKNVSQDEKFFSLLGINSTILDFDPVNPYATALLGDNLHISGGVLQMYDGLVIVEHGFHMYPETLSTQPATNVVGGLVFGGNYAWQAAYRWTDNYGQEHRSAPSIPVEWTVAGSFAPTGTWTTTVPVTLTTVTTGPTRNGNTITLQVLPAASNPTNRVLMAVTGTAAAVVITITPNSGANNGGIPVNMTTAQLANFIQSGVGSVAGTYLSDGINITTSGAGLTLLNDLRASGGGPQNLADGGEGDGLVATLANGANASSATIRVPTLRLSQKRDVVLELYRTEASGSVYYLTTSPTNPIFNDPTVDYIDIVDTTSDAVLISKELLYTTGGVLENIAAPPAKVVAVHTASNRVFLGGLEDQHTIQYSKIREAKKPVEFNDALTIAIDPVGGPVTAMASMDEKLVIFAEDALFYIAGNGPTNTGEQNNFIEPERISPEIGCIEPESVVLTPEGLMFKSRKGIYLLTKGLGLQYIGAPVQAFNGLNISSAKVIPRFNQVRFTTTDGECLVYNYFVKQWATFDNHQALGAEIIQNDYYYVRTDGSLFKENPESYSDNGSAIRMLVETGWMSFAGLQGFQRVYRMLVLGTYKSQHSLRVKAAYDFNEAYVNEASISPNPDFISGTAYGEDSPYGSGSPYGGDGNVYQARFDFQKQKCQAVKLLIEDEQLTPGEGLSLSAFTLEVGVKTGANKVSTSRKFGLT